MKQRSVWVTAGSVVILLLTFLSRTGDSSSVRAQVPNYSLFLPVILRAYPLQTVFGVGMELISDARGLTQMAQVPVSWVRGPVVPWSAVEPNLGARNWDVLSSVDEQLRNAASRNMTVIVIVASTPSWAWKVPNSSCGPIAPGALGAFGNFMHDLVARYSLPPYNVKYWELWNEPDIGVVAGDNPFGCWGDPNDMYFGGRYYAQMLQAVYPRIKEADPTALVLVGGLLLDCNPDLSGACSDSRPPKFLEGILVANGGAFFDGVSFHAYDYYLGALGQYRNSPNWNSYWNTTGPASIAKANYINEMLAGHGVTGKFSMNTESALLCDLYCDDPTFETTKAYYVAQVYAASIAEGLRANIWFDVFGWRNSGLLNPDLSPRPAYTAFQFARSELRDANFTREINEFDGVKGYELIRGGQKIWILWSLDGNSHSIPLPAVPLAAWDAMGSAVPIINPMTLDLKPRYLEMP